MESLLKRPLSLSILLHFAIIIAFLILLNLQLSESEFIDVPLIVNSPQKIQEIIKVTETPKVVIKSVNQSADNNKEAREVFGTNRFSYTDESVGREGIEAKKGNTLARNVDKTILLDSDVDSLPVPTEEYLVSEMPKVISEVRPLYPKEAKIKELEGTVVLDVLIDEKGMVRQVLVLEGDPLFQQEAIKAMKNFKFSPAKVEGQPVAVRIRYSLNFVLEY